LKDLSFKIKPGEKVAIVGPSGSGKTTITKLIYRHYEVSSGEIMIDNNRLKDLDLENYRNQLGIVLQEVGIFNRSIKENIAYGMSKVKMNQIIKAAKLAQAQDFIERLPKGYDTLVGERGIKLSGGQRQRLGIARAIIRDPKILIFDEATSSLDAQSEAEIQKAIKQIALGRTMLVIAHRLSTIKYMDRIIVIEDGQAVEEGTHEELTKQKGLYAKLSSLQSNYQLRE
jgi:ATP-binding cassette, subfamily B, bacterial